MKLMLHNYSLLLFLSLQQKLFMWLTNMLYSSFGNKCPKCHKGNVFKYNNPYNLKHFDEMNTECPCCGEIFERETGFYYGAMYVSYAWMSGWFIVTFTINSFFIHAGLLHYLIFFFTSILILSPMTFRVSRITWLNFFVKYDPKKSECQKNEALNQNAEN